MDEDIVARMVAVLCASIMAAAAAGEKDHVRALATSDIYLDFIRPRSLRVGSDGAVSFEPDEGE